MQRFLTYFKYHKSKLLPIIILVLLIIATFITLIASQMKQNIRPKAALNDTGQLTFENLTPTSVAPGNTFTVSINMNGGTQNVVGADIIVCFDRTKLSFQNLTKNTTTTVYKTYAPVDSNGIFDTAKIINNANTVNTPCSTGNGVVEFGIASFDWTGNVLTSPTTSLLGVSTLTFQVKPGTSGSTVLSFVNNGISSTTDSNIVVNPISGDPEDILAVAPYTKSNVTITIAGLNPTPSPSATPRPTPSPSATPRPTPSPSATPAATPNGCDNPRSDVNQDGTVNTNDVVIVRRNYLKSCPSICDNPRSDVNQDGTVNTNDVVIVRRNYLKSCP